MSVAFNFQFNFENIELNKLVDEYEKMIVIKALEYNIYIYFERINNTNISDLKIEMLVLSISDESKLPDFYENLCIELNEKIIIDFSLLL